MRLVGDRVLIAVALPHGVVVEVVCRRDLDAAGAELRVGMFVGDDRDTATGERQFDQFADQVPVALVLGVHRDRAVAEHGLRAGGGDHQMALAVGQRVAHVPHVAVLFLGDDLQVGDRGVQLGVPVDQAFAAVDQALFVQADEDLLHRLGQALVHGEALVPPVQRRAQAAQLAGDVAAGFGLPFPDPLDELFATEIVTGLARGLELTLDHHLGGDARMVGARLPQGGSAAHAVEADQGVHHGIVETVAHVQAAGDIRRRDHDAIGLALSPEPGSNQPRLSQISYQRCSIAWGS